jgi:hypothetical protein
VDLLLALLGEAPRRPPVDHPEARG